MKQPIIKFEGISKNFNNTQVLDDVSFEIEEGNLMLYYTDGDNPPDAHIDNDGCLILTIE